MSDKFQLLNVYGNEDLAKVYIGKYNDNKIVECVASRQPPLSWQEKWVLIISCAAGCPIKCLICDAGGDFRGMLSAEQMLAQVDFLVQQRFYDLKVKVDKFKVQFARMGEPALNPAVLTVLKKLPGRYHTPDLMACISTIAPRSAGDFFTGLLRIKNEYFDQGRFQMQFSVHSTDQTVRDYLMPIPKWRLSEISEYGNEFYTKGDRKITLNFALGKGIQFEPEALARIFSPDKFLIKFTPINPTYQARIHKLESYIDAYTPGKKYRIIEKLSSFGFDCIVSIGENEENQIGSNCGQYVARHQRAKNKIDNGYSYIK